MTGSVRTAKKNQYISFLRKGTYLLSVVLCSVMSAARAGSSIATPIWSNGPSAGQAAAHCGSYWPDNRPFTVPRTIVVDNSAPNGTVLHSWSYDDFLPNFELSCAPLSSNFNNGGFTYTYPGGVGGNRPLSRVTIYSSTGRLRVNGHSIPVELRLYVNKPVALPCVHGGATCVAYGLNYSFLSSLSHPPGEIAIPPVGSSTVAIAHHPSRFPGNVWTFLPGAARYSFRAELVKVGNLTPSMYGTATSDIFFRISSGIIDTSLVLPGSALDGTGIKLVPPSCRLKTQDYAITMGRWAADTPEYKGLPAEGSPVPVNLELECNGAVNHVQFRFQDAGSSPLSTGRVSLYDSSNQRVDGLSIALRYQGNPVPVDGVTTTDAGAFGHYVDGSGAFNSGGVAGFDARYVQNQMTITKGGANYTGPVTGKVNMFVTYN